MGIADHHVSENLITNYLYQKENAYFYSLDARSILDKLLESDSEWKSELTY